MLTRNARAVAIAATGYVLQRLNTTYRRSDNGAAAEAANAAVYVSNALEVGLEGGVPTDRTYMPPAVFITNVSAYRYASFPAAGNSTTRAYLRGTIIACWNTATAVQAIQIYYVNGAGKKGPLLHSIPLNR